MNRGGEKLRTNSYRQEISWESLADSDFGELCFTVQAKRRVYLALNYDIDDYWIDSVHRR